MNCEFCDHELHLSHYEGVNNTVAVYDCVHCPVLVSSYFLNEDFVVTKLVFMIDRHGKSYMWTNDYIANKSYITELNYNTAVLHRDPCLIAFPKVMNINPTNVQEKLSFYLTFL